MNLFKKTSSAWALNGVRVPKGTPGAARVRTQSKKWYVSIDKKHVPLSPNKRIAEELAAQLLGKKAAGELNLKTRNDDEARKPLPPLVDEWTAALVLKGATDTHVAILKARVNKVLGAVPPSACAGRTVASVFADVPVPDSNEPRLRTGRVK